MKNAPPAADKATMLRALKLLEAGHPDQEHPLWVFLIEDPHFQIIRENEPLRNRLRAFLEADEQVYRSLTWLNKLPKIKNIIAYRMVSDKYRELEILKQKRDVAFRDYEVFRKLTCFENRLLRFLPTEKLKSLSRN